MPSEDEQVEQPNNQGAQGDQNADRKFRPHIKPPNPLSLKENKIGNWKLFKKRWDNYIFLSNLECQPRRFQVAQLENCLADDALITLGGLQFESEEQNRTITEISDALQAYAIGEVHETYERFVFGNRQQKEEERIDEFISDLRVLIKSCRYCEQCEPGIMRDRIILGIRNDATREELLKIRKLDLANCIDVCRAAEAASSQTQVLKPNTVNKITGRYKTEKKTRRCKYCAQEHVFEKGVCPAWGKTCTYCKGRNHLEAVCLRKKAENQDKKPEKRWRKHRRHKVHKMQEEAPSSKNESSDAEWLYSVECNEWVNGVKDVKCKMLIDDNEVVFQIDTGASVNTLPRSHVSGPLQPYKGILKMWNGAVMKPAGVAWKVVRNPKTNKKYNVEFIIFQDNQQPLLGLRTSEQMGLIKIEDKAFQRVNMVDTTAYADVFDGQLGSLPGTQTLMVKEDARPIIMADRRVPIAVRPKLKEELDRLEKLQVITPVTEPTPWVSQIVTATKKSGALRICIDPHELNKVLLRERYVMPILEDTLHEMRDSRVFTKADLTSGYWHVKMDKASSMLTTCQTNFGRYRWLRLPFGLSVSAEIFQKKLLDTLKELPGVVCIADDVIVHGQNQDEHDKRLLAFLKKCQEVGIKLSKEKLELAKDSITFMGHRISKNGLESDPHKVTAIKAMARPTNIEELRRFNGIVNYLAKFLPNLASTMQPLHNLMKKDVTWTWSSEQEKSFSMIKDLISNTPVLALYDPNKQLTLENDACEYGLGSALLQDGRPVAYASRSLSEAERRYAQIEKEMLAMTYGLEKFHHYTFGREVQVTTDHRPLVAITAKPLAKAPRRLQNLLLRAQKYQYILTWKEGKNIPLADALSRAPTDPPVKKETVCLVDTHRIKDTVLEQIRCATSADNILADLGRVIMIGWPEEKEDLANNLRQYHTYRDELTMTDGVIYRSDRVIIPTSLRAEMKKKIHAGHLGINSCLRRARDIIFWPGMSAEIRQHVEACDTCATYCDKHHPI
jgi:hypothetical protein